MGIESLRSSLTAEAFLYSPALTAAGKRLPDQAKFDETINFYIMLLMYKIIILLS